MIVALAGYLARAWPDRRWPGLGLAALAGLLIACIGVTAAGRDLLRSVTEAWPGVAVLRDAQQFVAPLALAEAAGFGVAVAWAMRPGPSGEMARPAGPARGGARGARPPGAGAAAARPGLGRRRAAAAGLVPGGMAGRRADDRREPGTGAACCCCRGRPTARRPGTTARRCFDPWSKLLSRPVIWNDGTKVGDGRTGAR